MKPLRDQSRLFVYGMATIWLCAVVVPMSISVLLARPSRGLPLVGVVVWFVILRAARFASPARRADLLLRRGAYQAVVALCDRALATTGSGAWQGPRRLVWLNRRTMALLGQRAADQALTAALEALILSSDPETLSNCAQAFLYLNRYEEAATAARLALSVTRERSVLGHAVLAGVMLARGMPAEAEALARAGLADAEALAPLVRPEHHAACLAAVCRAQREQGNKDDARELLLELQRVARQPASLRALALLEEVEESLDGAESLDRAFALLAEAYDLAPRHVLWYVSQPGTVSALRDDERFALAEAEAEALFTRWHATAPDHATTARALTRARDLVCPRPAPQASRAVLNVQVATLAGTLLVLLWWTWRFFIVGA